MNRRERRATTKSSRVARNTSVKGAPDALCETGLRHFRAGQYLDAQLCCQQALEAKPDHAAALHLMGLLSLHAKQYDHATEWLTRAIRLDPNPEYLVNLGTRCNSKDDTRTRSRYSINPYNSTRIIRTPCPEAGLS
jgi:Tfp pilus assembly protein PilF